MKLVEYVIDSGQISFEIKLVFHYQIKNFKTVHQNSSNFITATSYLHFTRYFIPFCHRLLYSTSQVVGTCSNAKRFKTRSIWSFFSSLQQHSFGSVSRGISAFASWALSFQYSQANVHDVLLALQLVGRQSRLWNTIAEVDLRSRNKIEKRVDEMKLINYNLSLSV